MRILRFIYASLYRWNFRNFGAKDFPQFNAAIGIAFLLFLNLFTLYIVSITLLNKKTYFWDYPKENNLVIVMSMFILLFIVLLAMATRKNLNQILEDYDGYSASDKDTLMVFSAIYVIGSFLSPIVIAMLCL